MTTVPELDDPAREALAVLLGELDAIAQESVRDENPGRIAESVHSLQFGTAEGREAAMDRIHATLLALAARGGRTDSLTETGRASLDSQLARTANIYRSSAAGALRAAMGLGTGGPTHADLAVFADLGKRRCAADLGLLLAAPGAAVFIDHLDDVEQAFTTAATPGRLAEALERADDDIPRSEHRGSGMHLLTAHLHHLRILLGSGPAAVHRDRLGALNDGIIAARAALVGRYGWMWKAAAVDMGDDPEPEHTGPVLLVVGPAFATDGEKAARAWGNSRTRYNILDAPSAADFADIAAARATAAELLESKGASPEDVQAARALPFGTGMIASGLHLLIREP